MHKIGLMNQPCILYQMHVVLRKIFKKKRLHKNIKKQSSIRIDLALEK